MTFSKPKTSAQAGSGGKGLSGLVNPYLGAGVAAGLLLVLAAVFVVMTADPMAAGPAARVAMAPAKASPARDTPKLDHAPVSAGAMRLHESRAAAFEEGVAGEAVIALPTPAAGGEGQALAVAPVAGLHEPLPGGGMLPVIAPDGRTPAQVYARPFRSNGRPRVALVIGGLGLNPATTRQAIEQLPPEITLSFSPYREDVQAWIHLARAHGHEVLLEAPMEPQGYPENDPGPYALMSAASPQETMQRMEWLLSRAAGYFGLINYQGERFVTSDAGMEAFFAVLRARGLTFVDDGIAAQRGGGILRASAERTIDQQLEAAAIQRQLGELEALALQRGQALGAGFSYPVTVTQAAAWAKGLPERGLQLAPVSALTARR